MTASSQSPAGSIVRAFEWLWLAVALSFMIAFGAVACRTLGYEYQLEWMEGGTLDTMARIRAGLPLYTAPGLDYVPYLYTPLYFYAASAFAVILGPGFLAPRLLSFLAAVGCACLIHAFVRGELGRLQVRRAWPYALLGSGLYLATFDMTGKWLHLARVDSLALLLLLAGCYALRFRPSRAGAVLAGALFGTAFLAKQSALLTCLPLLLAVFPSDRSRALLASGTLASVVLLSSWAFDAASDGWFRFYVFELPRHHAIIWPRLVSFWTHELAPLWIAAAGSLVAGVTLLRRERSSGLYYLALFAALVGSSYAARMRLGGWVNSLMPATAALAIGMPIGLALLRERGWRGPAWLTRQRRELVLSTLTLLQLLVLVYDPRAAIPSEADRRAGAEFLRYVGSFEGEVLIPNHRFLQTRVGKTSFGLGMAADDLARMPDHPAKRRLIGEIREAIASARFAAVILHTDRWTLGIPGFHDAYVFERDFFGDSDLYIPVTGYPTRPTRVYVRRGRRAAAAAEDPE